MTRCDREHLAKRIVQHYKTIAKQEKSIAVHHFMAKNMPRQTIYSVIQRYEISGIVGDRSRSDRPKNISTGQRTRLKRLANHHTGLSLRKIG